MRLKLLGGLFLVAFTGTITGCDQQKRSNQPATIDSMAGNGDVAAYLKSFQGRGALTDSSVATPPADALKAFRYPADLAMDLVLAEPSIVQPVEISFDRRGRLWVVQYNQYPYPKGVKIMNVDNYLRVTFNKTPAAPPDGIKGADKITVFEDTDGDGKFDKSVDAITGLNIATSVALGRHKIWVMNPPYLLAYPDPDGNGLPDGPPEIHVEGFGMQDTHAVANSLNFGPDGWLYGAQGSTTTSTLRSAVTKKVFLEGQAIWRYHPSSHRLERFAEGGGNNPFNIEFDASGRLFSGSNGSDRGPYYKQGGYYIKSWGKHGPLSNPYALGYLPNMAYQGENKRFTHAMLRYEGGALPQRYNGRFIALNPLLNFAQLTRIEPNGSTFRANDEEHILETTDRWFRPVDLQAGPDGSIYISDWYDSRLSHIDPRDTWHKSSGRIYRLRNKDSSAARTSFNLDSESSTQLVSRLSHQNRWFRHQAVQVLGERKDPAILPALQAMLRQPGAAASLEALWTIYLMGAMDDSTATTALRHQNPMVRMWAVRLLGDAEEVSRGMMQQLSLLAGKELHPEVRSQLAATAKRLPAADALHIIGGLLASHDDSGDPDIPLQCWWTIESKAESDRKEVLAFAKGAQRWNQAVYRNFIAQRLLQRYVLAGGQVNDDAALSLLEAAPKGAPADQLLGALEEALEGTDHTTIDPSLRAALAKFQQRQGANPVMLALRRGDAAAMQQALAVIANKEAPVAERLGYIRELADGNRPSAVPALLKIVEGSTRETTRSASALRIAALEALFNYDDAQIGDRVVKAFPAIRADPYERAMALQLLAGRKEWAIRFLKEMDANKTIPPDDVPAEITRQLALLEDPAVDKLLLRLWPKRAALSTAEKTDRIKTVSQLVATGKGDQARGRLIFLGSCGSCHRLFKEGGTLAPELTGYDRNDVSTLLVNIIDPNADIREGYELQRLTTRDGRVVEGKIVARSAGGLTIQPPRGGRMVRYTTEQIRELRPSAASFMPERLLDTLTDQEVRDLFAYLRKK